ncbi:MAG: hypothetical protein J5789_01695 [Oscillospiraceae bacterium]|nr:hypothetical protein [Oscillospiraceae bacterium]
MKKLVLMLLCFSLLLSFAACTGKENATGSGQTPANDTAADTGDNPGTTATDTMPTVLNQTEYILYQNIFYNDMADDYVGKTVTKEGTLARLYDAFSGRTRYYVWGYMDATKCCDWQWEFVPKDPDSLPANGSLIKMTGTLTRDESALDKLWFTDTTVELETSFSPEPCDVDMTTMDSTLERVQLLNMQYKPDVFAGKTLRVYGRVLNPTTIQHPYYDNAWTQAFAAQAEIPANGTMVILTGTWQGDTVQADRVEPTPDY